MIGAFTTTDALIDVMATREGRAVEIPAGNGIGNARGLARAYAAAIGEVGGVRLLKAETLAKARVSRTDQLPPLLKLPAGNGDPQRFGLGFELPRATVTDAGRRIVRSSGGRRAPGFRPPRAWLRGGLCLHLHDLG